MPGHVDYVSSVCGRKKQPPPSDGSRVGPFRAITAVERRLAAIDGDTAVITVTIEAEADRRMPTMCELYTSSRPMHRILREYFLQAHYVPLRCWSGGELLWRDGVVDGCTQVNGRGSDALVMDCHKRVRCTDSTD